MENKEKAAIRAELAATFAIVKKSWTEVLQSV